jgi:hypothetical protein
LDALTPNAEPNGYIFNVSERLNEKITLEPEIAELIKTKVSKIKINAEAFMKLFENGEYQIKLGIEENGVVIEVPDYNTLPDNIKGKFTRDIFQPQDSNKNSSISLDDGKLIYTGELSWGDIVNKLIKLGFGQNSQFDKDCGSNSYKAVQYGKESIDNSTQPNTDSKIVEIVEEKLENIDTEEKVKKLVSFDTPTDIVIYGCYDDIGTEFQITDDETSFNLNANGKVISISSNGFGSVVTLDQYKNIYSKKGEEMSEYMIVEGVVVTGFQGTIGIGAINNEDEVILDIDLSDYIQHQAPDDDYYQVFINVPGNSKISKLNDDLSLPMDLVRDIKIENIIK